MRNIRYRIWDKKHNRWFHGSTDPQAIATQTDAISLFGETIVMGGLLSDQNEDDVWKNDPDIKCTLDILDWLEVCEGTGVKDKNGREIFESDILRWHLGNKDNIMVVRWKDDECCFELHFIRGNFGNSLLTDSAAEEYEIIGNIYENPELLEEKIMYPQIGDFEFALDLNGEPFVSRFSILTDHTVTIDRQVDAENGKVKVWLKVWD